MSVSTRTLGFYNCYINAYENGKNERGVFDKNFTIKLIEYINSLPVEKRMDNIESQKKVYCLKELMKPEEDIITIVFQSGKYGHNPDYLSSIDGTTRPTEKHFEEAEEELTHLCIKLKDEKAIFLLEERRSGMSINRIIDYFNSYINDFEKTSNKKYSYHFFSEIYPARNIADILNNFSTSNVLELYAKKDIIGDEMKEFSGFKSPLVRDQIILTLKSERRESFPGNFLETVKRLAEQIIGKKSLKYTRVRLKGKNNNKNPIVFDTEVLRLKEQVESLLNENGTVNTQDILAKMVPIIKELE